MALIYAEKNRGKTKDLTIQDGAGATIIPGANDKLRIVIGREGKLGTDFADAQLVVTSDAATANGSTLTKNSPTSGKNRMRLDASDLDFEAGVYTLFFDYLDVADS